MNQQRRIRAGLAFGALALLGLGADEGGDTLHLRLRSRSEAGGKVEVVEAPAAWSARETAIIVCDMWDSHHCKNVATRVGQMAPTMDRALKAARARGVVIIHAPSGCVDAYKGNPARLHAASTPRAKALPAEIGSWCYQIPSEAKGAYPIDQSDGGEDDDPAEHAAWAAELAARGRNPKAPWKSQVSALAIEPGDYISDDGGEIWSILEDRKVKNVLLMGVHLNMCVLGRPFGLRQMAKNGKNAALVRDLTDTMYNPRMTPHVDHFTGTDLMVAHVEAYVAPTLTSDQILGGTPFRFPGDRREDAARGR